MIDRIEVWQDERGWWFAVWFQGQRWQYAGIPNQCETRRKAIGRAMRRLAWHRDGTHAQRYR